jgi:pimeloyl-ACP methyl ester carboxylesterase
MSCIADADKGHWMESGTYSKSKRRKWWIAAALLIVCLLLIHPMQHALFAVRLAVSLQKMAAGNADSIAGVQEAKVRHRMGDRDLDALVYYPTQSPATSAIVLAAGLSEQGCHHPRLIALSKLLAGKGVLVVTPDIMEFRKFDISPKAIDQILFWHKQIPTLEGSRNVKKTGLAGISFSGTIAMLAAARPEIRDSVGFIVAIGPYSSLIRCTKNWFAAGPITVTGDYHPTRFYAKWIVMRAALEMIKAERDRVFLDGVLNDLLLQKKVPPAPADLTPEGARWYALATMRENQSDPELSDSIERHLVGRVYPLLSSENAIKTLRCPVFLIHGAYDDLIPPEESIELHQNLARSYLLISPFLTHTHPTDKRLSFGQKIRAAVDALAFSYHLSKVIQ